MDFLFVSAAGTKKKKKQATAAAAKSAAPSVTNTPRLGRLISVALESPSDFVCDNELSVSSFALRMRSSASISLIVW